MKRKWEKARFWLVICDFIEPLNSLYSPSYNSLLSEVTRLTSIGQRRSQMCHSRIEDTSKPGTAEARERESIGEANVASQDKRKIA